MEISSLRRNQLRNKEGICCSFTSSIDSFPVVAYFTILRGGNKLKKVVVICLLDENSIWVEKEKGNHYPFFQSQRKKTTTFLHPETTVSIKVKTVPQ